jgi:hypothetical protein
MEKLTNTEFHLVLDTEYDAFEIEADFDLEIQDLAGNTLTNTATGVFEEVIRTTFPAATGSVSSYAAVGAKEIQLSAGHTVTQGAVIQFGTGQMRAVTSVNGNIIKLASALSAPVTASTAVTGVGNTGIFRAPVKVNYIGPVLFLVSHPDYGNLTIRYDLVSSNIDTVNTKIDAVAGALGASKTIKAVL